MAKKKKDAVEKFWDDLHHTKIRCQYCESRLPSRNDDGVTPGHCLNLCDLPYGMAMRFNQGLHEAQMAVDRQKAIEKAITEE